jgi:hypothetical protein
MLNNEYDMMPTKGMADEISMDPVISELLMVITDIEIDVLGNVPVSGGAQTPQPASDKITSIRNIIMDATSRLRQIRQKTRLLN